MRRLVLLFAVMSLPACLDFGDKNTTFVNGQTQGSSPTNASPVVADPALAIGCPVRRLAGGVFGDVHSVECVTRVANVVPVGCVVYGTVTPLLEDGTQAAPSVHGQNLDIDVIEGSDRIEFSQDDLNLFNYTLKRLGPGMVRIRASLVPPGCPLISREYFFP